MKRLKKSLTFILVLTLVLQHTSLFTNRTFGEIEDFRIVYFNVRSSADTAEVYPGSKRVDLKVEAVYQNSAPAQNVVGWLNTTVEGIGFSSGSGSCSAARLLNGSVA
ncbi:MAG: hypothetical protein ACPLZC_06335, partial [Candidatus Bathyarchaeales archaeon]